MHQSVWFHVFTRCFIDWIFLLFSIFFFLHGIMICIRSLIIIYVCRSCLNTLNAQLKMEILILLI